MMTCGEQRLTEIVAGPFKLSFLRQTQLTITKLERALEDVLEKLEMPALDLYVSPSIVGPHLPPRSTRHNSEEPVENERAVSPDPLNSLIEATQLNGLRSQLRSVKQRRKGGMRRMDCDMISEKVITFEEADEMLVLYATKSTCAIRDMLS